MKYPSILNLYRRNEKGKLILGEYAHPAFPLISEWVFTEKVDGTNIRVIISDSGVSFAGKTDNAQIPPHLLTALEAIFKPLEKTLCEDFPTGAILYGEGYGPKIQNGHVYRDTPSFILFDVLTGKYWLEDTQAIASKYDLRHVPTRFTGTLTEAIEKISQGMPSLWGDFIAEGVVGRPKTQLFDRQGNRIIVKIKHQDFKAL